MRFSWDCTEVSVYGRTKVNWLQPDILPMAVVFRCCTLRRVKQIERTWNGLKKKKKSTVRPFLAEADFSPAIVDRFEFNAVGGTKRAERRKNARNLRKLAPTTEQPFMKECVWVDISKSSTHGALLCVLQSNVQNFSRCKENKGVRVSVCQFYSASI